MVDDPDTVTMPGGITSVGTLTVRGDDTFAVGYAQRRAGPTGIQAAGMNNVGGGSDDFSHAIVLRPASSG
jgi:hypothetical protein